MAPKQAKLGYVKSSQQSIWCDPCARAWRYKYQLAQSSDLTLNSKFVGKSGDALKQQSTLSFKTPSARKEGKHNNDNNIAKQVKREDEDVEMTNGGEKGGSRSKGLGNGVARDVKGETETTPSDEGTTCFLRIKFNTAADSARLPGHSLPASSATVKQESSPPSKRTKKEADEAEDDDDDDDEPIRKKPRRSVQTTTTSSKSKSDSRSSTKPAEKSAANAAATASTPHPKNVRKTSEPIKSSDQPSKPKVNEDSKETMSPKADKDAENGEEDGEEENEEDEEDDAEEEKPEIAKKKREKVQSTLSSQGKDPYPDWKPGEPVPYAALCTTFSLVEMTTKRLVISAYCSAFLRQVLRLTPQDLLPTVQLMINKLAADYAGIELGIGESLIMKAIGESTGRTLQVIKADQSTIGDLGLVAIKSRSNQKTMFKPKPLTVKGVLDGLMGIATVQGSGSQGQKIAGIRKLLSSADLNLKSVDITKDKGGPSEAKFIIRFLEGKLRLGLAERTVVVALAHAMVFHETAAKGGKVPSADELAKGEAILKTVFRSDTRVQIMVSANRISELPSYEVIIPAMLEHGIFHLRENCKLQPGVPLKPMLAKPTKSITEVLDRFEGKNFTCEYKYDGERAQIHYVAEDSPYKYAAANLPSAKGKSGISAIFSRNSEDLSKKYPDVLAKLSTWIKEDTKSFVLDCETVAWDLVEKKVLPFQQLMTRKRKDVKVEDVKVKVCVFAFDMLFYNGEVRNLTAKTPYHTTCC